MNCPCTSSASTNPPFPICLRVLKHARLERPASMRFLYVASQVLARRCPATIVCWLNGHLRRLPSHGRSPFRSCLRLVFVSYELSIWYTDSCKKIGTKHRGLSSRRAAPHKLTPMLGVLERKPPNARLQIDDRSRRPGHRNRSSFEVQFDRNRK